MLTELEAIAKVHARRAELDDALRAAMPKSLYWLGTGVLSNHIVSQLWRSAVLETEPPRLDMEVTDETFVTSVIFVYRRYLTGQSVLATTVREQAWIGRVVPHKQSAEDMTLLVMRVLRWSPGALITEDMVCELDLELKRALTSTDASRAEAARQRLNTMLRNPMDF